MAPQQIGKTFSGFAPDSANRLKETVHHALGALLVEAL